jgi:hypothetical protein
MPQKRNKPGPTAAVVTSIRIPPDMLSCIETACTRRRATGQSPGTYDRTAFVLEAITDKLHNGIPMAIRDSIKKQVAKQSAKKPKTRA